MIQQKAITCLQSFCVDSNWIQQYFSRQTQPNPALNADDEQDLYLKRSAMLGLDCKSSYSYLFLVHSYI